MRPDFDLRWQTAIHLSGMCDKEPVAGDLGVDGAKVVDPGNADQSLVYLRQTTNGSGVMPPIVRETVDGPATEFLESWIDNMNAACESSIP